MGGDLVQKNWAVNRLPISRPYMSGMRGEDGVEEAVVDEAGEGAERQAPAVVVGHLHLGAGAVYE